jgi:predicted nuclease of predicted toxin-antitoxin system
VNRLFIEIYLDEDVHVLIAELLERRGFSAVTTRDAGNLGLNDSAQLAYAVQHGRAILTHNRSDFERLAVEYFEAGIDHHGIILAVHRTPFEIVNRAVKLLNQVTADEMLNQLKYL